MTEIAVRQEVSAPAALVAWADAASAAHRLTAPLVQTPFVPEHFRPKANTDEALRIAQASACAAVLFGAEAGLSPLQALQGIYVIGGKPAMYARTMHAITVGRGHEVWTEELTDTRAIVCGRRRGAEHVERVVWTIQRAQKAGYTRNAKYNTDPQSMLLARAQADACRRVAPDALLGMSYSVEELEDEERAATETAHPDKPRKARRTPLTTVPEPSLDEPETPAEQAAEAATDQGDETCPGCGSDEIHSAIECPAASEVDAG